jgi:hypothetical protein
MRTSIKEDEIAYLCGKSGTIALAKTLGRFFYLDAETEEIVLFTEHDDLVVASAFSTGSKIMRGLKCTIYQIRELQAPLIVLPKGHRASQRLNIVVSIGQRTRLLCNIQPGTHPEQNVLCASDELHGLEILAAPGGAEIKGLKSDLLDNIIIEKL